MAAPSKNFDAIADAEIDPDSPITSGLLTKYRNRDDHLEEWLGLSFTAAQDHDHDGVNSAAVAIGALFDSAVFDLSGSGVGTVSTGALSFTPKIAIAVGTTTFTDGTENGGWFIGFARGTGALAKSLAGNDQTIPALSVDADAIGGAPTDPGIGTSHIRDLDVTTFQKASPGIELTPSASLSSYEVKLLVFGFTV